MRNLYERKTGGFVVRLLRDLVWVSPGINRFLMFCLSTLGSVWFDKTYTKTDDANKKVIGLCFFLSEEERK